MSQEQIAPIELSAICNAFHLTWDMFPTAVLVIDKDRTIRDVNLYGRNLGIEPGAKCFQLTCQSEVHQSCRANLALKDGCAQRLTAYVAELQGVYDSYWLPIPGRDDLYIHYSIDISEHARPDLFPK
jgi:hypothetical protein